MDVIEAVQDKVAEVVVRDWCSVAPDFDFGENCCQKHDQAYERDDSAWRLDRKIACDWMLGMCIAKHRPGAILRHRIGYVFLGVVYFLGVSTFGMPWWIRGHAPTMALRLWGRKQLEK